MEFEEVIKTEETTWRQRSKVYWLKNGDKHTKYFYRIATTHERRSYTDSLEVNGNNTTDCAEIKETVLNFYQQLYKKTEEWRLDFQIQGAASISSEDQEWLERQFEEEEILECIRLCVSDKAPGPDSFSMSSFQVFWEVLKEDIKNTLH